MEARKGNKLRSLYWRGQLRFGGCANLRSKLLFWRQEESLWYFYGSSKPDLAILFMMMGGVGIVSNEIWKCLFQQDCDGLLCIIVKNSQWDETIRLSVFLVSTKPCEKWLNEIFVRCSGTFLHSLFKIQFLLVLENVNLYTWHTAWKGEWFKEHGAGKVVVFEI